MAVILDHQEALAHPVDIYSHRTYSHTIPTNIRYNVALENMIRSVKDGESLHHASYMFIPEEDSYSFMQAKDLLNEVTQKLDIHDVMYNTKNDSLIRVFGINDKMVLEIVLASIHSDGYYDMESDEEAPKELAGIEMNVAYIGTETVSYTSLLSECGFKMIDNWRDKSVKPGDTLLYYAFPTPNGSVQIRRSSFSAMPFSEIKNNYSENVQSQYAKTLEIIEQSNSGLIILNGPSGTGKSYLLRALLTDFKKRSGIICTPPTEFLNNLGILNSALIEYKSSFVIFEDVGDMLTVDASSKGYVNVLSNLLNQTDGLLSLMSNTIFVLSFNYNIDKINEALLRPGRCLSRIEIGKLPQSKAKELTGLDNIAAGEYSLAEIYEMIRTGKALDTDVKKVSIFPQ